MTKVAITGASGYLATAVIKEMLDDVNTDYILHCCIRSEKPWLTLENFKPKNKNSEMKIFSGTDLMIDGSYDEAFKGCEYVLHTASPFSVGGAKDPYEKFINPAVNGTANVLNSVNKTESIKRVVLTSSTTAIEYHNVIEGKVYTEEDWNDTANVKTSPYPLSKKLAEQKAWEINKAQNRWSLIVLNPGLILGSNFAMEFGAPPNEGSIDFMKNFFNGMLILTPDLHMGIVDVKDVARAHVLGLSTKSKGRHILVERVWTVPELVEEARKHPTAGKKVKSFARLPNFIGGLVGPLLGMEKSMLTVNLQMSNKKAKEELGLGEFSDVGQALRDTMDSMIKSGVI